MISLKSRKITVLLAILVAAASSPIETLGAQRRPERTLFAHRKGRVAVNLPPGGMLARSTFDGSTMGIKWPGVEGTEFLGRAGFTMRFILEGDEKPRIIAPEEFRSVEKGSAGRELYEGCLGGKRYPSRGADDDGDGRIDEDPFDGTDNDGDGEIDEDFAAIGHGMAVTRAAVPGLGLVLTQNSYSWAFGHVRDFVGFTSTFGYFPRKDRELDILGLDIAHITEFRIGREDDGERGRDDVFFLVRNREDSTGESPREEPDIFGAASEIRHEAPFAAIIILAARVGGRETGTGIPAIVESPGERGNVWRDLPYRTLIDAEKVGGGKDPADPGLSPAGNSSITGEKTEDPADEEEYTPISEAFERSPLKTGEMTIVSRLDMIERLSPGEEVTIEWAIVFGRSEEILGRNVERAIETYNGMVSGEGGYSRWIVPARKAERIELKARLAPVWVQGERKAAVCINLPGLADEEVEWFKIDGEQAASYECDDGRLMAPVDDSIISRGGFFELEGQLTDGTMFRARIEDEDVELFTLDDSVSPEKLPEDCLKVFPNPFAVNLNINLNVHEAPAIMAQGAVSGSGGISSVRIYDVKGRLVRTVLEEESLHPGDYSMGWDGNDENGMKVQPGVYYCKLQIGDRSVTKRVVLLR